MRRVPPLILATAAATAVTAAPAAAATAPPARPADPIVVSGAEVRPLSGVRPARIAAFKHNGRGWRAVRVQVDERAVLDLAQVYGDARFGSARVLTWTDATTLAGADPDPGVDPDDQLALMGDALGRRAPRSSRPRDIAKGARRAQLVVRDPLTRRTGYVTLFESSRPKRFRPLVEYRFGLASGDYRVTYKRIQGPNPERTTVATRAYRRAFSDRWVDDVASVGTGPDLLDRHTAMFPGTCGRHENTFISGEGAFVTNRAGPVRAIRSYIGANSGPFTQRDHIFYSDREQIDTYLRVHAIPGISDLLDFSQAARGMTYRSSVAPAGVTIDGRPDALPQGRLEWEQVTGAPGTITSVHSFETDIPGFDPRSRFSDFAQPRNLSEGTCTGDGAALGVSGPQVDRQLPNTDPRQSGYRTLTFRRTLLFTAPRATADDARALARRVNRPLTSR